VVAGEGHYEWLEDEINIENKPLFNNFDISRLREARRAVAKDIDYLGVKLPEISSFPQSIELIRTHRDLSRLAGLEAEINSGDLPKLLDDDDVTFEKVCQLGIDINLLFDLEDKINSCKTPWLSSARDFLNQKSSGTDDLLRIFDELGKELEKQSKDAMIFYQNP
jgi:hypothetical protein